MYVDLCELQTGDLLQTRPLKHLILCYYYKRLLLWQMDCSDNNENLLWASLKLVNWGIEDLFAGKTAFCAYFKRYVT